MNWKKLPQHILDSNPELRGLLAGKKAIRLASDTTRNPWRNKDKAGAFLTVWKQAADLARWGLPAPEYEFDRAGGWRLDWAWADNQVAVEVDGGQWEAQGGRHARDSDRAKCNRAVAKGWYVFHFSPDQLETEPVQCVGLVIEALKLTEPPF